VVRYCDLSLCDGREEALRIRELDVQDAQCDLPDVMCALAYQMNVLDARCALPDVMCALAYQMYEQAYRKNELDALCDLQGVMCALAYQKCASAYRMSELLDVRCAQGVMCALAYRMYALDELDVLLNDALDVHCALKQILLRVTLASRP
jgi:hypothetical protein